MVSALITLCKKLRKIVFSYNDSEQTLKKDGLFSVASASNQISLLLATVMALHLTSLALPEMMSMI
jgi:hypothetical protein